MKISRNWLPDEIRARGFDPVTGARVKSPTSGIPGLVGTPIPIQSTSHDPGCCCQACRPRWSEPVGLSASARSKLQPEQLLQVQVIEQLRPRLVPGARLFSLNGELPGGSDLFRMWQTIRQAMGYEPGTPDLCACHGGKTCFIELKRPRGEADLLGHRKARGELSAMQRAWRDWAHDQGYGWTVARSVAEVETTLAKWGMI